MPPVPTNRPTARARVAYHRNPALERSVDRVRSLTGTTADDYDHVELYSCFPSMPKLSARVLGPLRPASVSVIGGLTFFGGPGSNYMTHGLATMVELLRANGGTGFLHGVGMFMTKHHAVVLADRPRDGGFATGGDVPTLPGVDVVDDYEGPGTIETYTVMYARDGTVERGVVDRARRRRGAFRRPGGRRRFHDDRYVGVGRGRARRACRNGPARRRCIPVPPLTTREQGW